jgi:hypothetical protein
MTAEQLLATVSIPVTSSPAPPQASAWAGNPIDLGTHRLKPEFPVDVLPGWVGNYVAAVAEATQSPADVAGGIALAALSTAAGGRIVVVPRPGWVEPVNIYTAIALPPGSRKSGVFKAMTAPLLDAERTLCEASRAHRIEAETMQRVQAAKAEKLTKTAENATGDPDAALAAAIAAQTDADEIRIPFAPQLVADDITPEAAASLLAEQGGRLAVLSAEGGVFAALSGRYSGTPNLEVFLKGHGGDLLRVNRRGREAEQVANPALTLGITLQPGVFNDIAAMPGMRDRGVLARFLYALPENTVGHRKISPDPAPAELVAAYNQHLTALVLRLNSLTEPIQLHLTDDAQQALIDFETWIEPMLDPVLGKLASITDWASKLTGAVLRLAGLLHTASHHGAAGLPITADTLSAAIRLGHYYLTHALDVFDLMGSDPDLEKAKRILEWITRSQARTFTRRDLLRAVRSKSFTTPADLDAPLELLADHGHIRLTTGSTGGQSGRPSVTYEVHPIIY